MIDVELLHVPPLVLRVCPSCGVPEMPGSAVFTGKREVTTAVGSEAAVADCPALLVTVCATRIVWPASAPATV